MSVIFTGIVRRAIYEFGNAVRLLLQARNLSILEDLESLVAELALVPDTTGNIAE